MNGDARTRWGGDTLSGGGSSPVPPKAHANSQPIPAGASADLRASRAGPPASRTLALSLAQLTDNPSDTPLTLLPKLKKHSYDDIEKKQNLMRSAGEL